MAADVTVAARDEPAQLCTARRLATFPEQSNSLVVADWRKIGRRECWTARQRK